MYCANCGKENANPGRFCQYCGKEISRKPETPPSQAPESNKTTRPGQRTKKKPTMLIAALMIAVLLVAGCFLIYLFVINYYAPAESGGDLFAGTPTNAQQEVTDQEPATPQSASAEETRPDQTAQESTPEENPDPEQISWDRYRSSSVLESHGDITYYPYLVADDDAATAWVEGVSGDGIGEWLMCMSTTPQSVSRIEIVNGYAKSEELYYKNNRIKRVLIEFSDGSSVVENLQDRYGVLHTIDLEGSVSTEYLKLTILDVYKGSAYQDTCLAEIAVYG